MGEKLIKLTINEIILMMESLITCGFDVDIEKTLILRLRLLETTIKDSIRTGLYRKTIFKFLHKAQILKHILEFLKLGHDDPAPVASDLIFKFKSNPRMLTPLLEALDSVFTVSLDLLRDSTKTEVAKLLCKRGIMIAHQVLMEKNGHVQVQDVQIKNIKKRSYEETLSPPEIELPVSKKSKRVEISPAKLAEARKLLHLKCNADRVNQFAREMPDDAVEKLRLTTENTKGIFAVQFGSFLGEIPSDKDGCPAPKLYQAFKLGKLLKLFTQWEAYHPKTCLEQILWEIGGERWQKVMNYKNPPRWKILGDLVHDYPGFVGITVSPTTGWSKFRELHGAIRFVLNNDALLQSKWSAPPTIDRPQIRTAAPQIRTAAPQIRTAVPQVVLRNMIENQFTTQDRSEQLPRTVAQQNPQMQCPAPSLAFEKYSTSFSYIK
jgi:hypothetical protein